MDLIYSFTVALFLTIALIPVLIRFSAQLQLLDDPGDDRKVHCQVIPRSGGIAIAIGVFLPLIFILPIENEFKGLFWGALTIVIFGYLDDRYELDYKWKFAGQVVAAIAVMSGGLLIHQIPFMGLEDAPVWISYPLTFLFILGVTNAVNLSDGLDGLAAGTTLLSLVLLAIFALQSGHQSVALMALTVVGGVLGFLRYNTFPARIFMGDTGSQFLGYVTACLAVLVSQSEQAALSPVVPLLILGLPILDTLTVMAIRIREGRSPFSPDKNHLHHQLMARGFKHYEAVAVIYLMQFALLGLAYGLRYSTDLVLIVVYVVFCLVAMSSLHWARKRAWQLRPAVNLDYNKERRNHLLRKMDWIYFNSAVVVEYCLSFFLVAAVFFINGVRFDFAVASFSLATLVTAGIFMLRNSPILIARMACYCASVFVVYLLSQSSLATEMVMAVDGFLIVLVVFLMLSIRMTRREDFRLDTQDLLVLLIIIIIPQLPFESLNDHSVGHITLQLAVLMYSCEFILAKSKGNFRVLSVASIISLAAVGFSSLS